MGITKQILKLMSAEHCYTPFSGHMASFGRQTVHPSYDEICKIFDFPRGPALAKENIGSDHLTRHHHDQSVLDSWLFDKMGVDSYTVIDGSDYEGADLILNLNDRCDPHLEDKFDLIYTGGCLDNVFNPISVLQNSSRMLRSGGRVFHYESFSGLIGAFLYFSPEFFYSYYSLNNFRNVKVYVGIQRDKGISRFDYDLDLFIWRPAFTRKADYDYFDAALSVKGIMYTMVVAEKGDNSTVDKNPIQAQYLNEFSSYDWRKRIFPTGSPVLRTDNQKADVALPFLTDHFEYCGSGY